MSEAARVLVMTPDEVEALVERAVERALARRASDDDLLTHEQAAAALSISPAALHKRVHRGLIEPDQRGGTDGVKGHRYSRRTLAEHVRKSRP